MALHQGNAYTVSESSDLLDRFVRFFFHGIIFYAIMFISFGFVAEYVSVAPMFMLVSMLTYTVFLSGIFVLLGSLNWLLASVIWDENVRGGFHGHLSHGLVLFIILGALSYFEVAVIFAGYTMAGAFGFLARAGGILFFSLLFGYVAKSVGLSLKEDEKRR